jgi:hypothetical protein
VSPLCQAESEVAGERAVAGELAVAQTVGQEDAQAL